MLDVTDLVRERTGRIFVLAEGGTAGIPVLAARGRSLAEAFENALVALYAFGCDVRTQYDARRPDGSWVDPPSRDATMHMVVESPNAEPLIHMAFPGGLEDLEEYRQEVLDGIKDHWIRDASNPDDRKWEYTYHERLFAYRAPGLADPMDQVARAVETIARTPYTRRAEAITWQPWQDPGIEDPPCLQRIWFRITDGPDGVPRLNVDVDFRSRDAYDAAFMNAFAFIALAERVADEVAARTGLPIRLGRYLDRSDSFHIYGRRLADFESRFIRSLRERTFEERTFTREQAEPIFEDARREIPEKIARHDRVQ
ncbi:MAG: hypothetical protein JXP34_23785 [Planctomycetes bacterium]|nr:hypothetical protein [Planctomycetota bacterium]